MYKVKIRMLPTWHIVSTEYIRTNDTDKVNRHLQYKEVCVQKAVGASNLLGMVGGHDRLPRSSHI